MQTDWCGCISGEAKPSTVGWWMGRAWGMAEGSDCCWWGSQFELLYMKTYEHNHQINLRGSKINETEKKAKDKF